MGRGETGRWREGASVHSCFKFVFEGEWMNWMGNGGEFVVKETFFSFKKLIYWLINQLINWRLVTLQYCGGFCHTLTWISHGCTCIPHSELPSHLPLHPIPLGCPSALALSVLFHALNLDWSSVSHMLIYMFQCYSLRSSHPCLLPQSPKATSQNIGNKRKNKQMGPNET